MSFRVCINMRQRSSMLTHLSGFGRTLRYWCVGLQSVDSSDAASRRHCSYMVHRTVHDNEVPGEVFTSQLDPLLCAYKTRRGTEDGGACLPALPPPSAPGLPRSLQYSVCGLQLCFQHHSRVFDDPDATPVEHHLSSIRPQSQFPPQLIVINTVG